MQVTGYTDSIGTPSVNGPLSQARAQSVVSALTPLTPGINYQAAGKGDADPVAPNSFPNGQDNPAGRALNRRVTIVFAVKKPTPPGASPEHQHRDPGGNKLPRAASPPSVARPATTASRSIQCSGKAT